MSITLIGLGYCPEHITKQAEQAIKEADTVILLTSKSPSYSYFSEIPHQTLDRFYEEAESFDEVTDKARPYLLSLKGDIALCSDGDGISGRIQQALLAKAEAVKVVPGVSKTTLLRADSKEGESFIHLSATDFLSNPPVEIKRDLPLIISEIDDSYLASEIKLVLLDKIGEDEILFVKGKAKCIPVLELDRQKLDHTASIIIPTKALCERERYGFSDLIEIMKILRAPTGCPWDREQTHESIRKNLIEEAYELDEAIEKQDIDMMTEEVGDVLLQSAFNALISEEEGEFTLSDALSMLCLKLINRHTHIFGNVKASNSAEALEAWENAKKKEKAGKGKFETVPRSLPALLRAQKILKCAGVPKTPSSAPKTKEEWGKILFDTVTRMRSDGVDGEEALQGAIAEFIRSEENRLDS